MPGNANSLYSEAGSSGLTRFGGYISEEWLKDLQGSRGVRIFREMRDNDAVIGAFLYAVEMLLRQVTWRVEKGGDSKADEDAATFLEECLDDLNVSWQDTLSEILSMLPFGWSFLEIVYKKRSGMKPDEPEEGSRYSDGKIGWKKWALRSQETLSQWIYDDKDNLRGMEQQAPPTYDIRMVPIEKALLFRAKVTKGNPEGRSLLRNAYRSWYMKKNIEEIEAIGIERDLAGLPVIWLPSDIIEKGTAETITAYNSWKKIITNIRRDEQEGLMMPLVYDDKGNKMYDITLLSSGSRRQFDTNAIIGRYDQRIAVTVMADFLLLGSSQVGSFALSSDKTNLFGVALGTILDSISGVLNSDAVPRLFALNDFGKLTDLPKFVHDDIESPDLTVLGDYITKLAGAQMPLFPDDDLENYLRSTANLPPKPEDLDLFEDTSGEGAEVNTGESAQDLEKVAKVEKQFQRDRRDFMKAVHSLQKAVQDGVEKK